MSVETLYTVITPLGFEVSVNRARWQLICTVKHPAMKDREAAVHLTLSEPELVRRSKKDEHVYLFYRSETPGRWICAVVKRLPDVGFLITAYLTDTIKSGEEIWKK